MRLKLPEVIWISDGRGDLDRVEAIVTAAVAGGLRCVQLRERELPASALARLCQRCLPILEEVGGMLLVNDRADLVAAGLAIGVHLGWRSLSPRQARAVIGAERLLGCSVHDRAELERAVVGGADYLLLSPVFATPGKPEARPLGVAHASALGRNLSVPVFWLGGIDADRVRELGPNPPDGIAVMRAIGASPEPERATARLLQAWREVQA